jgi:hypothetical protein
MNDIDLAMERINALDANSLTPDDISIIIAYHRQARQRKADGVKAPKASVDISAILGKLKPAASTSGPSLSRRP